MTPADRPDHDHRATGPRRFHPGPLLLLTLIWMMLWRDISPGNIVIGLLLATLISVTFPLPPVVRTFRVHPWHGTVLVVRFLADVVRASLEVAYASVAPWRHPAGRFTTVRLRSRQDLLRTVTAELTSLVPGSLVVDLDRERGLLMLHLFDAPDDQAVERAVARVHQQEDRLTRAVRVEEVD